MEENKNDALIPNYIGYAVILLTACHLGCEVDMVSTAEKVWQIKLLPEASLLGLYAQAAYKAIEMIRAKGLGEKADRYGEAFYMTGKFPDEKENKYMN